MREAAMQEGVLGGSEDGREGYLGVNVRAGYGLRGIAHGLRRVSRERLVVIGLFVIIVIALFCFVGPLIYHTNQIRTNLIAANLEPSSRHLLGTDSLGYDVVGRLMYGGQSSLEIGFAVSLVATSLGVLWGAVAGFIGGIVDAVMMRVVDVMLAIPALFLVMYLATIVRPTIWLLIGIISFLSWLIPARLVRGETLRVRVQSYVEASRAVGGSRKRLLFRHIIPNCVGVIIVNATFQVADAILLLALLSFLGFGLPPPSTSWGAMLAAGVTYIYDGYWWEIYPAGVMLVLTVVALNLLGDGLRDLFDARLRVR